MSDNHYNKYYNEFPPPPHYQVKANVNSNNGINQQFLYDVNTVPTPASFGSNAHLDGLSDCVKRLQTHMNQYLTKIIDEGSDGPTNYNLGSGEVLNSHLMEQYSSLGTPSTGGSSYGQMGDVPLTNGYSYYSNYPPNYPAYPTPPQAYHHSAASSDYYNQQYSNFQEPKIKKQKHK